MLKAPLAALRFSNADLLGSLGLRCIAIGLRHFDEALALAGILTLAGVAGALARGLALAGVDPLQWTAAFLAEAGAGDRPPMASAIAATARVAPDTILVFTLISSGIGSQGEHLVSSGESARNVKRSSGEKRYKAHGFVIARSNDSECE